MLKDAFIYEQGGNNLQGIEGGLEESAVFRVNLSNKCGKSFEYLAKGKLEVAMEDGDTCLEGSLVSKKEGSRFPRSNMC